MKWKSYKKMKIEIVEFYSIERDDKKQVLVGTMHIYMVDLKMDIRGVFVKKRKNSWFFSLPAMNGKDLDSGERVRFPVLSSTNNKINVELKDLIRTQGIQYIEKNILSTSEKNKSKV